MECRITDDHVDNPWDDEEPEAPQLTDLNLSYGDEEE
jgi:hypothetical protein